MARVARLTPLTRIRRLVATLAARRVAAMMLARLEIADGDILVLSLGGQTTRSAETRMRLALRSQLDAARLCRRAGIDGEVFWIASPDDARTLTQTSFIGRLRQLSAWEQATFERANIAFEIKELL